MIKDNKEIARGKDIYGNICIYEKHVTNAGLYVSNNKLIELSISENLTDCICCYNHLKTLKLNKPTKRLACHDNQLTYLKVAKGTQIVYCYNNQLKELKLPDSVYYLKCDKEVIDYDKCKILDVNILYEK
jgi:hypothetical protein